MSLNPHYAHAAYAPYKKKAYFSFSWERSRRGLDPIKIFSKFGVEPESFVVQTLFFHRVRRVQCSQRTEVYFLHRNLKLDFTTISPGGVAGNTSRPGVDDDLVSLNS